MNHYRELLDMGVDESIIDAAYRVAGVSGYEILYNEVMKEVAEQFPEPTPLHVVPDPEPTKSDVMRHYADELERIYENRTAGDFTFLGVLAHFTREWEVAE